jgi:hypothetical protein
MSAMDIPLQQMLGICTVLPLLSACSRPSLNGPKHASKVANNVFWKCVTWTQSPVQASGGNAHQRSRHRSPRWSGCGKLSTSGVSTTTRGL